MIHTREAQSRARLSFSVSRGRSRPFGATPLNGGVNFAIFSRHATGVNLVLFREDAKRPLAEIPLDPHLNRTGDVWHIHVMGLDPHIQYGYRMFGPFRPEEGLRFCPDTVLLDPYALSVAGNHPWGNGTALRGNGSTRPAPRARLVVEDFDWEGDVPLRTPMAETILYELHVRGYTCHPSSGVRHPGTFLGLCEKIPYLQSLGVTAVQLMPVLEFDELDQARINPLTGRRLKNYWGYAPISFFAPKAGYAVQPGRQVTEFKQMVKTFHRAGIEVVLDLVYNHTSEGNELGPSLSFRGLDNAVYYCLDKKGRYHNFSGCGNTVNCNHPVVQDLIIESLVYLVTELHVDGFRFDLASILGRGTDGKPLKDPPLLRRIAEHPVLADAKLIAEPWDIGGLYLLGRFPNWGRWFELNGQFRDDVRRFIRGDGGAAALAKRICGSHDLYHRARHHGCPSINFVTCHDGFTLLDLVSYNEKHNWANGEENRDGSDYNLSWNCGHEGPVEDPSINALRHRQMRNFLTLLLTSHGVPFLYQGDEFARTQCGNNNAYCQDNDLSWVNWELLEKNADLVRFTRMLIALRKRYFSLSAADYLERMRWHGTELEEPDWTGESRTLAFQMHEPRPRVDLYVMMNANGDTRRFTLPQHRGQWRWRRLMDTQLDSPVDIVTESDAVPVDPPDHYDVSPFSVVLLIADL